MFRGGPKVGRNAPCPCGSGRKFKKCHGAVEAGIPNEVMPAHIQAALARAQAEEVQRTRQQGLGHPIISFEAKGYRLVAVKNRLMYGKSWKTFHDFLGDYIKMAIGPEWGNQEIAKPLADRHPILQWYDAVCTYQRETMRMPGGVVTSAPMIGAVAAYVNLAYDLFGLDHNAELQERLLARLRNRDNFLGARYEIRVASQLIRAGFDLEFENEEDGSTTHCEFTATYRATGRKFSVEAKFSEAGLSRLIRQLRRGLEKAAMHERIIFIDANTPDDGSKEGGGPLEIALKRLRRFEGSDPAAKLLPAAYVFVTNTPWAHHLAQTNFRCSMLGEGFHIPDFKQHAQFSSLRDAIEAKDRHKEMHALLEAVRDWQVPSTFDGEIAEYAFGEAAAASRLLIGNRYEVNDGTGGKRVGVLTTATVLENEGAAYCGFQLEDGRHILSKAPLSPAEIAAWKRHPDTFFGIVEQRKTTITDPVEFYEFVLASYKGTTKQKLLEFLAGAPDIEMLSRLEQPALASVYAERLAARMWQRSGQKSEAVFGAPGDPESV